MRTMFRLSTSAKRFVAAGAAVLFLACQGMTVARGSSMALPQSSAAAMQHSCHDAGWNAGENKDDTGNQGRCQSQNASSNLSKANIFAATDLPAITIRFDRTMTAAESAPQAMPPLARIEPPPHSLLHCCLRN